MPHFENQYWTYRAGDWFDADPCSHGPDEAEWVNWYGPDLIKSIVEHKVGHEIGCHTFSHIVFSDVSCPPHVAAAELQLCQELANRQGFKLRSFAFPGNLAGNFASLRTAGFTSYRFHSDYELDAPRKDQFGTWRIPGGVWLENPFTSWTSDDHVKLLRNTVDTAIKHGLVCSLWFHPETDARNVDEIFPEIFAYIAYRRADLWITTMGELAQWLDSQYARV